MPVSERFHRADDTPVVHGEAIPQLIQAMLLPTAFAAHQKNDLLVAQGNNLADEAAKDYGARKGTLKKKNSILVSHAHKKVFQAHKKV